VRFGAAVVLLLVLVVGVPRLLDSQTWILLQAVRDLGPLSGWRCAQSATYVYDPGRERPDSTLLSDPPEARVLAADAPGLEVDQVEANLRGGDTLVSVHVPTSDGSEDRRVYVLSPGRLQAVSVALLGGQATLCNAHLGDWQIVGEQQLAS
jgi:hypothetical protein